MRVIFTLIVVSFVVFCGLHVVESGLFKAYCPEGKPCILLQRTTADGNPEMVDLLIKSDSHQEMSAVTTFEAYGGSAETVKLGSIDPKSGFMYELELSTKGAAIGKAAFSGFDDRDYKDPQPLVILSPVVLVEGTEILSMANREFVFVQEKLQLSLQDLHFKNYGVEKDYDGSNTARFEAVIKTSNGEPAVKLLKTYKVRLDSYLLDCSVAVENLTDSELKYRFNMAGPTGLGREAFRTDRRQVIAGFKDSQGQISSVRLNKGKLIKAKNIDDRRLPHDKFLWAATVNKYFAAILVPEPDEGKEYCGWLADKIAILYNPDGDNKADSGDETVGLDLKIASSVLAPAGQVDSAKTYNFQLYLEPKDKSIFDKNELYRSLSFVQAIDFMPCFCCPTAIIHPLAFGILAIMKWMYGFIGNYGVVIIILVFLMRLIMHPITKKGQVSMSKFQKVANTPEAQQIKKKYANNRAEQQKQMMGLYKKYGVSPATQVTMMLPMFVQMPIWIALWSAVYASIDLRGAAFLPFWITDLSVPDALVRFSTITLPLMGWKIESLNLLPILMGIAFYLQQKLMPSQAAAAANPQVAQQQKMMMIMLPLMFPLMLYTAPSGVNLYIMASTFAGVFEQHIIRKHIREKEEVESVGLVAATSKTGGKVKKKKPKPLYKW